MANQASLQTFHLSTLKQIAQNGKIRTETNREQIKTTKKSSNDYR